MSFANYNLVGNLPDGQSERFVLTGVRMTVGRQGDVLLHHASVSRHHAILEYLVDEGTWAVSDMDSRNGTQVNGAAIQRHLLPLRERKSDIPDLVRHFIDLLGGRTRSISSEALEALTRYSWPGNVRELRNVMERTLVLSENDRLEVADFPAEVIAGGNVSTLDAVSGDSTDDLEEIERKHIKNVLAECMGNKRLAAERLGISRSTLFVKER